MDRPGAVSAAARVRAAVAGFAAGVDGPWCVALSGGADSLALTAAAAALRPTVALIVDHRLQDGSDRVAARAAEQALGLGCQAAEILTVTVGATGGPEAAARTARNAALQDGRGGRPVLLGHTLDDQAETVLLGLGRGSGARSLSGMAPWTAPWGRPLLGVRRAQTRQACADWGLEPWQDPHNDDPRYARVRVRENVMPVLESELGPGIAAALARTATLLREDAEAFEEIIDETVEDIVEHAEAGISVS
ncbi:MAG TPA: tRNA lysidine(34) synthetase TilS, partial [Mycolicibacterium fallax]|nr:tRNA lysidine(34) synthetase TilS [Mycolicibacterium fallax]